MPILIVPMFIARVELADLMRGKAQQVATHMCGVQETTPCVQRGQPDLWAPVLCTLMGGNTMNGKFKGYLSKLFGTAHSFSFVHRLTS